MKRTAFSPHDKLYIQHLETSRKHNMSVQHYHDSYEVYLQLEGKRYIFYDNVCYTMERGDLAVFPPFVIHYAQSREADYYERYVLNVREETLNTILSTRENHMLLGKLKAGIVRLTEEQTQSLYAHFVRVEEYTEKAGFLAEKLTLSAVLQLLMYVVECKKENVQENKENKIPGQIIRAINYVNHNYKEDLSLDRIAEEINMSKYHFCRTFKNATGATVAEYLNNVRLTKVHSLLVNSDMSVGEIAGETGFGDTVNLSRNFKKVYGVSPAKFKKQENEKRRRSC